MTSIEGHSGISCEKGTRVLRSRAHPVMLLAVVMSGLFIAAPAHAHVAMRLLITSPEGGARVSRPVEVAVLAQASLGGMRTTTFTATLDGRPIDSQTGEFADAAAQVPITVGETKRVLLREVAPGAHEFRIAYRPDLDAAVREESVTFVVLEERRKTWLFVLAGMTGLVLAGLLLILRKKRSHQNGIA